jgi:hypothetical protein
MFYRNQKVVDGLNTVKNTKYQFAVLLEVEDGTPKATTQSAIGDTKRRLDQGNITYVFMFNPESFQVSLPIAYSETAIPYTAQPITEFKSGGNREYYFPNLILDASYERKSIKLLLDRLEKLREPRVIKGNKVSPPILQFKWGSYTTPPIVLTQMDYTVTRVTDGQPTKARLNLRFKEVLPPAKDSDAIEAAKQAILDKRDNTDPNFKKLKKPLSQKQQLDGIAVVDNYLKANTLRFSQTIRGILKSAKSEILINKDTGEVAISNGQGLELSIGVYNGDKWKPSI